jgi:hypothetical protein
VAMSANFKELLRISFISIGVYWIMLCIVMFSGGIYQPLMTYYRHYLGIFALILPLILIVSITYLLNKKAPDFLRKLSFLVIGLSIVMAVIWGIMLYSAFRFDMSM